MRFLDISVPLRPGIPVWPGSMGIRTTRTMQLEAGDRANVTHLDCDVHVGTHVDAPIHFLSDGPSVETMPLHVLIGRAVVAYFPQVDEITANALEGLALEIGTERLLLRTRNSKLWTGEDSRFDPSYVALTVDAARWIVDRGIRLVGIDYLSIQRYQDGPKTHQILLGANVIILEGLNLAEVAPGTYELVCLPLKIVGADGAPARAVLRQLPD